MHVLVTLLFFGFLVFALGLMASMLGEYSDRILTALQGPADSRYVGADILKFPTGALVQVPLVSLREVPLPLAA